MKQTYYIKTVLTALATTAFMACTESYPTMILEETKANIHDLNSDSTANRTPVLLFINQQDLFTVTATRGMGEFPPEDKNNYSKGAVYIYAFRDGRNTQGELTSYADLTKSAYATGYPHDPDFADCLIDGDDYTLGLRTFVRPGSSGELKYTAEDLKEDTLITYDQIMDHVCYYSDRHQEAPYNFFAYYIDELDKNRVLNSNVHRTRDSIWYDISIDGTQDIMCGMAPPLKDVLDTWYPNQNKRLSDNERSVIRNGYSKFSADRDIHPYIRMEHQLTQLKFKIYPGDATADDIVIQKIEVLFRHNGHMTIATQDPSKSKPKVWFDGTETWGNLNFPAEDLEFPVDESGNKIDVGGYTVNWDKNVKGEWYDQSSKDVGRGLILPCDTIYEMRIHYKQKAAKKDGSPKEWSFSKTSQKNIELNNIKNKWFQPGQRYVVSIAVFGQKGIQVYTAFEKWKDGGSTEVIDDGW